MNPRTRRAALYAIGAIAILASGNALAHSYAGLYDWTIHHRLSGWQAMSWPAEIDVFLAIGELALYVAYLDGWPARQKVWPWTTAIIGLTVSVAGNIGHIQPQPGHPVILADRLTAATSPLAAFAGLTVGLVVLKMTRQHAGTGTPAASGPAGLALTRNRAAIDRIRGSSPDGAVAEPAGGTADLNGHASGACESPLLAGTVTGGGAGRQPFPLSAVNCDDHSGPMTRAGTGSGPSTGLLRDAALICQSAAAKGERLSQRTLARQLRSHGHRFPNQHLRLIAVSTGFAQHKAA